MNQQAVQCPNDGLMSGFHLLARGSDVYYRYACCNGNFRKTCMEFHTGFTEDGNGNTIYLDRQGPDCPRGYGMRLAGPE